MPAIIRLVSEADAAQIQAIYAPIVVNSTISFEMTPPTTTDIQQRLIKKTKLLPWLVCEREGQVLGYAYADPYRVREAYQWSVEVTVYTHADARRMGVGRAVYTSLFETLRLLGYYTAYAGITLPNEPSIGFHRAMGFSLVGTYQNVGYKDGAWRDVAWWELPLQDEYAAEPAPPRPFAEGRRLPDWETALAAGLPHLKNLA